MDINFVVNNILQYPERLGLTAAYIESDALRYKQYGKYNACAVHREGSRLLGELSGLESACDMNLLRKWNLRYLAWQKKLRQLKQVMPVHGEFAEAGKIILYKQAISKECAVHGWDYEHYFNSVLVHERVHYLQHQAILQQFGAAGLPQQCEEYKKAQFYWFGGASTLNLAYARTVKETLAEFIRFLWCVRQGYLAVAQAVTQRLMGTRAYYPAYPYAGVRGLCALYERDAEAAVQAWQRLWQMSLASWQEAYKFIALLNGEDFVSLV